MVDPIPIPRSGTKISSLIGFAATEWAFGPVVTFWIQVGHRVDDPKGPARSALLA